MRLQWTEPATRDLEKIAEYYEQEAGARIAATNILKIIDSVKTLLQAPHRSRPGRIPDTRELVLTSLPYLVPYRVNNGTVQVLRVFHTAQQTLDRW